MQHQPTDSRRIPLLARDGSLKAYTIVDADDYAWLMQWRWCLTSHGYVKRDVQKKCVYMHRQIANAPARRQVDHVNGDRLDNRRANLRLATGAENSQNLVRLRPDNTSGFRGVTWCKTRKRWIAQVHLNGKNKRVGRFKSKAAAAAAAEDYRRRHMPFSQEALK